MMRLVVPEKNIDLHLSYYDNTHIDFYNFIIRLGGFTPESIVLYKSDNAIYNYGYTQLANLGDSWSQITKHKKIYLFTEIHYVRCTIIIIADNENIIKTNTILPIYLGTVYHIFICYLRKLFGKKNRCTTRANRQKIYAHNYKKITTNISDCHLIICVTPTFL
jgi:hypothetical protein